MIAKVISFANRKPLVPAPVVATIEDVGGEAFEQSKHQIYNEAIIMSQRVLIEKGLITANHVSYDQVTLMGSTAVLILLQAAAELMEVTKRRVALSKERLDP